MSARPSRPGEDSLPLASWPLQGFRACRNSILTAPGSGLVAGLARKQACTELLPVSDILLLGDRGTRDLLQATEAATLLCNSGPPLSSLSEVALCHTAAQGKFLKAAKVRDTNCLPRLHSFHRHNKPMRHLLGSLFQGQDSRSGEAPSFIHAEGGFGI